MAEKPILGYWHIRGLAEAIRYLLDYLNIDFENKTYLQGPAPDFDRSAWTGVYENIGMIFPNLPYFWDGDLKISETLAIFQYIASQYGPALAGTTNKERAEINQLGGVVHDLKFWLAGNCYSPDFHQKRDNVVKEAKEWLAYIGRFLGDKQFLFGDQITWPDFIYFESMEMVNAISPGAVHEAGEKLELYRARIAALPQLQRRLTGERLPWNNTQAAWL
jgi:glutathione S-transferase